MSTSVKFRTAEGSVYEIEFNQDNGISAPGGRVRCLEGEHPAITKEWRYFQWCGTSYTRRVAFGWNDGEVAITPPAVAVTNPETGEWEEAPAKYMGEWEEVPAKYVN